MSTPQATALTGADAIHPALTVVLGNLATTAQPVAAAPLVKCRVSIKTADSALTYEGLFASTCSAVIDAQARIGPCPCLVRVRVLP